jgi:hypothetical protein
MSGLMPDNSVAFAAFAANPEMSEERTLNAGAEVDLGVNWVALRMETSAQVSIFLNDNTVKMIGESFGYVKHHHLTKFRVKNEGAEAVTLYIEKQ